MPITVQRFGWVGTDELLASGQITTSTGDQSYNSPWVILGSATPKTKWRPPTNYSHERLTVKSKLALHCRYEQRQMGLQPARRYLLVGDVPTVNPDGNFSAYPNLKQVLINSALVGMVDQKFNLLTSLVEFHKTADHLASVASRLTRAAKDVKKCRFKSAARKLGVAKPRGASRSKNFSQNWLEYKYGWMPLVADAYGAAEHLATLLKDEAVICSSRKRNQQRVVRDINGTNSVHVFRYSWKGYVESLIRQQVVINFQVDYSSLLNLKRLGILDPGATAWESVPYSFVFDWFAPVGDWLSQVNAWQGLIYKGGCYSLLRKNTTRVDLLKSNCTSATEAQTMDFGEMVRPGLFEAFIFQREVLIDPKYRLKIQSPVSLDHAISAIALLRQQF